LMFSMWLFPFVLKIVRSRFRWSHISVVGHLLLFVSKPFTDALRTLTFERYANADWLFRNGFQMSQILFAWTSSNYAQARSLVTNFARDNLDFRRAN
jgi:hypothetical protein